MDHSTGKKTEDWRTAGQIKAVDPKQALKKAKNMLCRTEHSEMRIKPDEAL